MANVFDVFDQPSAPLDYSLGTPALAFGEQEGPYRGPPVRQPAPAANPFDQFDNPFDAVDPPRRTALEYAGNLALGIGERAGDLAAGFVRFATTPVDLAADFLEKNLPLGAIEVTKDGIRVRPNTPEDLAVNPFVSNKASDLGYEPVTTWEDVKKAPLSQVIPFALEQGIVSAPDMAAVMYGLPAYIAARTGEIGQQRAVSDERGAATVGDFLAAAPAAIASALLERLGTHKILGVDEVTKAFSEIPKQAGKAALTEAGTEAGQEGIEYLGEQLGTKKGVSLPEGAERMAAGAIGGGPFGGAARTVTGVVQALGADARPAAAPAAPPAPAPLSPEAQRAVEAIKNLRPQEPAGPPPGGAPAPGEAFGLTFPGAPSRRATVEQYFDDGDSVRVIFDDGTKADFLTEDVLRDRTPAPPPMGEPFRGPEAMQGALTEAEALARFDEAPPQPSPSRKAPAQPKLAAEAIIALDQANELERIAISSPSLPTEQRTAFLMQAATLRQKYGVSPTPAPEAPRAVPPPAKGATDIGPLGKFSAPPGDRVVPPPPVPGVAPVGQPLGPLGTFTAAGTERVVPPPGEMPTKLGPLGQFASPPGTINDPGGMFPTVVGTAKRTVSVSEPSYEQDEGALDEQTRQQQEREAREPRYEEDGGALDEQVRQRQERERRVEPRDIRPPAPTQPELPPIIEAPDQPLRTPNVPPEPMAFVQRKTPEDALIEKVRTVRDAETRIRSDRAEAPPVIVPQPRAIRRADLIDADGQVDMGKAGATLASAAQEGLDAGATVTLWNEGKPTPITQVIRGMIADAKGQRWGAMGILAPRRGDDDRLEITPRVTEVTKNPVSGVNPVPQENIPLRSGSAQTEDTGASQAQTPTITPAQAKQALRTNIDPSTGKRPQGKAALARFRQQMRSIMTGKPIASRAAPKINTQGVETPFLQVVKGLGGIQLTRGADGKLTKEAQDVAEALKDARYPGVINAKGKTPDRMREALRELGWFGVREDEGADMDSLYDALRTGNAFPHPGRAAKVAAPADVETPDRMQVLQTRAYQMGIKLPADATEEELETEILEREAMREDAAAPVFSEAQAALDTEFAKMLTLYDPLEAQERAYGTVAPPERLPAQPAPTAEDAEGAGEPEVSARREEEAAPADTQAEGRDEGQVPPTRYAEEAGAVDQRGKALPQKVLPGAEQSEEKSAAARKAAIPERQKQELELRAKQSKMRRGGQESAGGMFAAERDQTDIFAPGSKQAPIAIETKADLKEANKAPIAEPKSAEQSEAGNYQKVNIVSHGLPVALEQRKGDIRRSKPGAKVKWAVKMPFAYGYFKKSEGYDGDEVDVFIGDEPASNVAFIIYQKDLETGEFDEHKVMLGFNSVTEARQAYIESFSDGKGMQRIINIQQVSIDNLKKRLNGNFFATKPRDVDAKIAAMKDPFADTAKSKDVRWFNPADFDVADDSENAERSTGWFWRDPKNVWQGPFATSELAAQAQTKSGAAEPFTFESFAQEEAKLRQGDMTAAEAMAAFERVIASEAELKAELGKMTKTQLAKMDPRNRNENKDVLVKSIYRDMLNGFNASGSYSWVMGSGDANAGIRTAMEKQTDETIKEAAAARKKRGAEMVQTYTDPQTLSQFQSFIRARGIDKLTPAQKERYDELVAGDTKASAARDAERAAVIKKVDVDSTMSEIIETKHTQKGHDLFVVQLADRVPKEQYQTLASAAKRLGGYYSSFRGKGAVPGFQFKTREAAEKFRELREGDVSKKEIAEARKEEVQDRAVDRLRAMADKMEADADETINADRKVNTARRARQAASSELNAAQEKAMAGTMRRIADALEGGDLRYIDEIRTRAEIETLEELVRSARTQWAMAERDKTPGSRFEDLAEQPITREMIDKAQFPYPYAQVDTLKKIAMALQNKSGMKRMAAAALKWAAELESKKAWRAVGEGIAEQEMLSVLAKEAQKDPNLKYEADAILDTWRRFNRVYSMRLQNPPTLRAALREFLEYRTARPSVDPIKVAERALIGTKIAGYFPTPPKVVDRMIEVADLAPGMKVLEPSAGKGNIADRLRDEKADVETIEPVSTLSDILKMKGHRVVGFDFLEHTEGGYDRIVMNPPFENRQDVDHVQHAFDLLAPGGRVVAIMSEGPFGSSDKKSVAFREWLEANGGTSERLPQGSFMDSERSTGVATRLVTIIKGISNAVTTFFKSESGTVGNQNPPEFDNIADAIAENSEDVPVGRFAGTLNRKPSMGTLGWVGKFIIEPRALARRDAPSARFWNAVKAEDHEGSALINAYRDLARPYIALSVASRDKVNAVLELDRLANLSRKDDGRRVVARNEGQDEAELSKPGQSIRLTKEETAALHATRRMFQRQWADLIRGTAVKFGWDGEPTSQAIKREAEGMSEREAKPLLRIADLLQALEAQERSGYVPLMRHGDYYIAVKRVGDEESLGGFPRVARFERMETKPGWEQLFGAVPGMSSRTKDGTPKVVAKRLAELRAKYPESEGFEIEHGNVSRNLEALRSLDIPAIEKFLMAIEGENGGLYGPLVEEARDRLYEELKSGFKKRSRTVPGYSPDFARSIGSYSHWIAYHVAQQIHGDRVQRAYDETQKHPERHVREFWQTWKLDDDAPMSVGDKVARGMTSAAFYYTMAANPSSALVTFDAPLAAHAVLSAGVGVNKTRAPFLRSMADGTASLRASKEEGIYVDIENMGRNAVEREFLKKMTEQGELGRSQQLATDFGALADHQAQLFGEHRSQAKKMLDISTSAFLASNEMSRAVTALTAFRLASNAETFAAMDSAWANNEVYGDMVRQTGRNRETLARFLTTEAAFEWGRKNRAQVLGRHALGSVVWQFKQFPLKFLSVTRNLMFNMGAPGKAAAAMLMASLWMYAGVQGLPFVQDAEKLFDWIWQQVSGEDPQARAGMYRLLDSAGLGKIGADVVMRGPLSVMFGADVSNRFGFGDLVSQNQSAWDFLGAGPSMLNQAIGGAMRRRSSGQSTAAVIAQAAPAAIKNPLQAFGVYPDEGAKTQTGSTLVKPEQLTVADKVARAAGFQPLKVSRAYDRMEHERRTRDSEDVRVSRVYGRLATLVQQQKEAREAKNGASVMRIGAQISAIARANADLGLTPRNVQMRVLQREDPSLAALKRAPRRVRDEMKNNPFPAP